MADARRPEPTDGAWWLARESGDPWEPGGPADPGGGPGEREQSGRAAPAPDAAHVVVADADPTTLRALGWLLKERGYAVAAVSTGPALLEHLEHRTPDVLLLDAALHAGEGFHLLEHIRRDARWRDLPVLMISAATPDELAVRTLGLGASDFIRKPFRVREVLARIEAHLRVRWMLRSSHETVRTLEEALAHARAEADRRRELVDIVHAVTGEMSAAEIYQRLAERVARALDLSQCSVVLAARGAGVGIVAADIASTAGARDAAAAGGPVQLDLGRYPEIRAALDGGRPVLVEDVRTSPLYDDVRRTWAAEGTRVAVRSVVALPFSVDRQQAGVFFLRRGEGARALTAADVEFGETVIRVATTALDRVRVIETTRADNQRLEALALTDPLTDVLNRRALTERLSSEIDRARRYGAVVSLLMIDLDHFKRVNDTYGHPVGDAVLGALAGLLQHAVRSVDVVARYGGEEFVVILPETGEPGAVAFAERIRERIERTPFAHAEGEALHLTSSIGVATFPSPHVDSAEELIGRADQALYRAKAEGRNRVAHGTSR